MIVVRPRGWPYVKGSNDIRTQASIRILAWMLMLHTGFEEQQPTNNLLGLSLDLWPSPCKIVGPVAAVRFTII